MIDFKTASDAELQAMRDAIDALTREDPQRIHTDLAWQNIVHGVNCEYGKRLNRRYLAERDARRQQEDTRPSSGQEPPSPTAHYPRRYPDWCDVPLQ